MQFTDADFGYPAWRGYIAWEFNRPETRAAFTAETGMLWPDVPKNGLEAMIDAATGYPDAHAHAFILWLSEQWGIEDCPPAFRDAIAEKNK